jgi:chromosome segregation ATPase
MIFREDLDAQQRKLDQALARKADLEGQVKQREAGHARLAELRAQARTRQKSNAADEQQQQDELAHASADLKQLRKQIMPAMKDGYGEKEVQRLQLSLASLRQTFENTSRAHEELAAIDAANEAALTALLDHIRGVKVRYRKLVKFKVRLPQPTPVILQMVDLERTCLDLIALVAEAEDKIPTLRAKIESSTEKNHLGAAEVERLEARARSVALEIEQIKAEVTATFAQLETFSISLRVTNEATKAEVDKSQETRAVVESLCAMIKKEESEFVARLEKCQKERAEFPARLKQASDDKAATIAKKKSILEEVGRKLDDIRQELIRRQGGLPIVQQLTGELEKEWVEHQRLLDVFERNDRRRQSTLLDLQRTQTAIREIEAKFPSTGKVKRTKGLQELEAIYEDALIQNRQMGIDLAALKDEAAVLQEMNLTLSAGLRDSN